MNHLILKELAVERCGDFKAVLRMSYDTFQDILTAIEPNITKTQIVGGHKVIKLAQRLALTLRFLATGDRKTIIDSHHAFKR